MKFLIRVNSEEKRKRSALFFRSNPFNKVRVIRPTPPTPAPVPTPHKPRTGSCILRRHFKSIMIVLTSFTVACVVTLVTLQFVGKKAVSVDSSSTNQENTTEPVTGTTPNKLVHYTFERSQWGGRYPAHVEEIIEPIDLVVIKHTGANETCEDIQSCFRAMQNFQNTDVGEHHLPDITYNFVIGGDGNIYVGRGWGVRNGGKLNNTIDIAYMGNFSSDTPSEHVVGAGRFLIVKGQLGNHLDPLRTKVVCHNQTEITDSPGANLYKEIVLWPWYSSENISDIRDSQNKRRSG